MPQKRPSDNLRTPLHLILEIKNNIEIPVWKTILRKPKRKHKFQGAVAVVCSCPGAARSRRRGSARARAQGGSLPALLLLAVVLQPGDSGGCRVLRGGTGAGRAYCWVYFHLSGKPAMPVQPLGWWEANL